VGQRVHPPAGGWPCSPSSGTGTKRTHATVLLQEVQYITVLYSAGMCGCTHLQVAGHVLAHQVQEQSALMQQYSYKKYSTLLYCTVQVCVGVHPPAGGWPCFSLIRYRNKAHSCNSTLTRSTVHYCTVQCRCVWGCTHLQVAGHVLPRQALHVHNLQNLLGHRLCTSTNAARKAYCTEGLQ